MCPQVWDVPFGTLGSLFDILDIPAPGFPVLHPQVLWEVGNNISQKGLNTNTMFLDLIFWVPARCREENVPVIKISGEQLDSLCSEGCFPVSPVSFNPTVCSQISEGLFDTEYRALTVAPLNGVALVMHSRPSLT